MDHTRTVLHGHPDRVYVAVVLEADGRFRGGNGWWRLGDPCDICADKPLDPARRETAPCRNPRGHAWAQVRSWNTTVPGGHHYVVAPRAATREEARAGALVLSERIRANLAAARESFPAAG